MDEHLTPDRARKLKQEITLWKKRISPAKIKVMKKRIAFFKKDEAKRRVKVHICFCYHMIAMNYLELRDYKKAKYYLKRMISADPGGKYAIERRKTNFGTLYLAYRIMAKGSAVSGRIYLAEKYAKYALAYAKKSQDKLSIHSAEFTIGANIPFYYTRYLQKKIKSCHNIYYRNKLVERHNKFIRRFNKYHPSLK